MPSFDHFTVDYLSAFLLGLIIILVRSRDQVNIYSRAQEEHSRLRNQLVLEAVGVSRTLRRFDYYIATTLHFLMLAIIYFLMCTLLAPIIQSLIQLPTEQFGYFKIDYHESTYPLIVSLVLMGLIPLLPGQLWLANVARQSVHAFVGIPTRFDDLVSQISNYNLILEDLPPDVVARLNKIEPVIQKFLISDSEHTLINVRSSLARLAICSSLHRTKGGHWPGFETHFQFSTITTPLEDRISAVNEDIDDLVLREGTATKSNFDPLKERWQAVFRRIETCNEEACTILALYLSNSPHNQAIRGISDMTTRKSANLAAMHKIINSIDQNNPVLDHLVSAIAFVIFVISPIWLYTIFLYTHDYLAYDGYLSRAGFLPAFLSQAYAIVGMAFIYGLPITVSELWRKFRIRHENDDKTITEVFGAFLFTQTSHHILCFLAACCTIPVWIIIDAYRSTQDPSILWPLLTDIFNIPQILIDAVSVGFAAFAVSAILNARRKRADETEVQSTLPRTVIILLLMFWLLRVIADPWLYFTIMDTDFSIITKWYENGFSFGDNLPRVIFNSFFPVLIIGLTIAFLLLRNVILVFARKQLRHKY